MALAKATLSLNQSLSPNNKPTCYFLLLPIEMRFCICNALVIQNCTLDILSPEPKPTYSLAALSATCKQVQAEVDAWQKSLPENIVASPLIGLFDANTTTFAVTMDNRLCSFQTRLLYQNFFQERIHRARVKHLVILTGFSHNNISAWFRIENDMVEYSGLLGRMRSFARDWKHEGAFRIPINDDGALYMLALFLQLETLEVRVRWPLPTFPVYQGKRLERVANGLYDILKRRAMVTGCGSEVVPGFRIVDEREGYCNMGLSRAKATSERDRVWTDKALGDRLCMQVIPPSLSSLLGTAYSECVAVQDSNGLSSIN